MTLEPYLGRLACMMRYKLSENRFHAPLAVLLAGLTMLLSGCASIGPDTISRDRFDYAAAITDSWKEQMLRNIVQLRYGEPPVFMEVASIINQYEFSGKLDAGVLASGSVTGGDVYTLGANAGFIDRPTITYNPLTGQHFAQSMLTPIPPASLFRLVQAGYPADFLFKIGTRAINGVRNETNVGRLQMQAEPEFEQLMGAIRRIQEADASDIRIRANNEGAHAILFLPNARTPEQNEDIRLIRSILGLPEGQQEFSLAFGLLPQHPNEVAILSRSMLEILLELSADIDAPQVHIQEGSTIDYSQTTGDRRFLEIHSATEEPTDAAVATRYRDHWYWIDNKDIISKRVLTFLMVLFSLAETGTPAQAPVVTVGAGS